MVDTVERDSKGIPLKSNYPEGVPVVALYAGFQFVCTSIGILLAWFLAYARNRDDTNAKIAVLASYDLGWLYAGIVLVKILQLAQSVLLGTARKASKVSLPDQHVYKVMGAAAEGSKLGYVLMENEGTIGTFNRAQRAWMNYHESFPTLALLFVTAGFVFPFEAFVAVLICTLSKIYGAFGYVQSENSRQNGFLFYILAEATMTGMNIIAAYKALST